VLDFSPVRGTVTLVRSEPGAAPFALKSTGFDSTQSSPVSSVYDVILSGAPANLAGAQSKDPSSLCALLVPSSVPSVSKTLPQLHFISI
jgi:hypothetical protein